MLGSALTTHPEPSTTTHTLVKIRQDARPIQQRLRSTQAMAEMGMEARCSKEYQKQQDSVNRDLQLLNTTQTLTKQRMQKPRRLWLPNSTRFEKLRSAEKRAYTRMGYNNQYNLVIFDSIKIWRTSNTQAFTGQNTVAQRNELIKINYGTRCYISRYS